MFKFIAKRVLVMIPVLLGVMIIVFTLNCVMPGDPVVSRLGTNTYTQEEYDAVEHEMGLDQPYVVRLVSYIVGVCHGDLGTSYETNQPVAGSIFSRMPITLELGILSTIVAVLLGIPIGVFSAVKQNTIADYSITTFSIILASLPGFWLALEAVIIFCLKLKWLPASAVSGMGSWKTYVLPVACNAMMSVASLTRMTRSSMLEVIRKDYIKTARSKGMKESRVIFRHALQNALIPVVTVVGTQVSMMVGGSVIIETIFNIPGMGSLMITGINNRDYPMILGITLVICVFVCVVNLLVDLVYSFIDPQIHSQFAGDRLIKKKKKGGETA
jgi:peptide/nickel transport system permease protein